MQLHWWQQDCEIFNKRKHLTTTPGFPVELFEYQTEADLVLDTSVVLYEI